MTDINEDALSLRVARSGTKRPKYGRLVPAALQCLLMISAIMLNPIYIFYEFRNYLYSRKMYLKYTSTVLAAVLLPL